MQVTKGTRRMREQCVPGSLSSSPTQDPGSEAIAVYATSIIKPTGKRLYSCFNV